MRLVPSLDLARAEAIPGWMSASELLWLATHALRARTIIEIGAFCGRSPRALADHCPGPVYAVDPWNGYVNDDGSQARWILEQGPTTWPAIFDMFQTNLADHLETGRVVAVRSPSHTAVFAPASADLVFVDGDHRYEACRLDIERYRPIVAPGGLLAGHDYARRDWPGVARAVDELVGPVRRCESIWWVRL